MRALIVNQAVNITNKKPTKKIVLLDNILTYGYHGTGAGGGNSEKTGSFKYSLKYVSGKIKYNSGRSGFFGDRHRYSNIIGLATFNKPQLIGKLIIIHGIIYRIISKN